MENSERESLSNEQRIIIIAATIAIIILVFIFTPHIPRKTLSEQETLRQGWVTAQARTIECVDGDYGSVSARYTFSVNGRAYYGTQNELYGPSCADLLKPNAPPIIVYYLTSNPQNNRTDAPIIGDKQRFRKETGDFWLPFFVMLGAALVGIIVWAASRR